VKADGRRQPSRHARCATVGSCRPAGAARVTFSASAEDGRQPRRRGIERPAAAAASSPRSSGDGRARRARCSSGRVASSSLWRALRRQAIGTKDAAGHVVLARLGLKNYDQAASGRSRTGRPSPTATLRWSITSSLDRARLTIAYWISRYGGPAQAPTDICHVKLGTSYYPDLRWMNILATATACSRDLRCRPHERTAPPHMKRLAAAIEQRSVCPWPKVGPGSPRPDPAPARAAPSSLTRRGAGRGRMTSGQVVGHARPGCRPAPPGGEGRPWVCLD